MNALAFNHAYDYALETFKDNFKHHLEKTEVKEERIFLTGNQAVAMGKVLRRMQSPNLLPNHSSSR